MARPRFIELSGKHSQGKRVKVDAALYGWLSAFCWRLSSKGYAIHCFSDGVRQHSIFMHRLICFGTNDDPREVDHRNGDKLDNRRRNLRPCTHAQNMAWYAERRRATEFF